jgi:hypothetical protein
MERKESSLPKYNRGVLVCIQDIAVVFGEGVPRSGTGGAKDSANYISSRSSSSSIVSLN